MAPTLLPVPPRFHPRQYTAEPRAFGKAATIEWKKVPADEAIQHSAARMQHLWAVEITRAATLRFGNLKKYAEAAGISYDRLTRVIRGEEIMRLEDIATAHAHLSIQVPSRLLT